LGGTSEYSPAQLSWTKRAPTRTARRQGFRTEDIFNRLPFLATAGAGHGTPSRPFELRIVGKFPDRRRPNQETDETAASSVRLDDCVVQPVPFVASLLTSSVSGQVIARDEVVAFERRMAVDARLNSTESGHRRAS